jgi:hypothetical protein
MLLPNPNLHQNKRELETITTTPSVQDTKVEEYLANNNTNCHFVPPRVPQFDRLNPTNIISSELLETPCLPSNNTLHYA